MSPDFEVSANLRFWPVLEIATFELLAENRPFGIAQRHQFKCNGHSPLVAGNSLILLGYSLKGCHRPFADEESVGKQTVRNDEGTDLLTWAIA